MSTPPSDLCAPTSAPALSGQSPLSIGAALQAERASRALSAALSRPGPPFPLPSNPRHLLLSTAPGLLIGSIVWPGTHALLAFLAARPALLRGARVLELGAGVGALGLGALALGASAALLTERAGHTALLEHNVRVNAGGAAEVAELAWGGAGWGAFAARAAAFAPTLCLGADLVYTAEGAEALAETLGALRGVPLYLAYKERGAGEALYAALEAQRLSVKEVGVEGEHRVLLITAIV